MDNYADSLVWQNLYLVEVIAKRQHVDSALVAEIGLEALQQAASNYDASKGVVFATYAGVYINNAIIGYRKTQLSSDEIDIDLIESTEGGCKKDDSPYTPIGDIVSLQSRLTPEEYDLLYRSVVLGMTQAQLGIERGVTQQAIAKMIQKIIAKARSNDSSL